MNQESKLSWDSAEDFCKTFTSYLLGREESRFSLEKASLPLTLTRITLPLGNLWVGTTAKGIALLEFDQEKRLLAQVHRLCRLYALVPTPGTSPLEKPLTQELREYFEGRLQQFSLPLDIYGTPFQKAAWAVLATIPYGKTLSYGEQAAAMGKPQSSRAVGQANGTNRIAILLPCHRVVGAGGRLTGYGGGLELKRRLLDLEKKHEG